MVFEQSIQQSEIFRPFPEREFGESLEKLADEGKYPYRSEGKAWYKIVEKFVTEWITNAGIENVLDDQGTAFYQDIVDSTKNQAYQVPRKCTEENLIKVLTQSIFNVTLYHELVGTVVEYSELPSQAGFRALIDHGKRGNLVDFQSYLYGTFLAAATTLPTPKLVGTFSNYFGVGKGVPEWEREVWDKFQEQIHINSSQYRKEDEKRRFECKTLDPVHFDCAVST